MAERVYIAIDLGASSGRLVAGKFDGQKIALEEVHRFDNGPVPVGITFTGTFCNCGASCFTGCVLPNKSWVRKSPGVG